jgi:hypothetical protein
MEQVARRNGGVFMNTFIPLKKISNFSNENGLQVQDDYLAKVRSDDWEMC